MNTIFTLFLFITCLLVSNQHPNIHRGELHTEISLTGKDQMIYLVIIQWQLDLRDISRLQLGADTLIWMTNKLEAKKLLQNKILQKCVWYVQNKTMFPKFWRTQHTSVWVLKKMMTQMPSTSLKLIITTSQMSPEYIISTCLLKCWWAQHVRQKENRETEKQRNRETAHVSRDNHKQLMLEACHDLQLLSAVPPAAQTGSCLKSHRLCVITAHLTATSTNDQLSEKIGLTARCAQRSH